MKYVKAIFENENVQALAVDNENLIQYATDHLLAYNVALENYVLENLNDFIIENDLAATYENIRNAVASENINFINESAIIIQSDKSSEEKIALIEGRAKDYFSGLYNSATKSVKGGYDSAVKSVKGGYDSAAKSVKGAGDSIARKIGSINTQYKHLPSGKRFEQMKDEADIKRGTKRIKRLLAGAGIAGLGLTGAAVAASKKD
jgi:hypothetical protein